jgi:UDP-glucose:(heptosyl)LPS alpha-1,3-glucosyltransferase
MIRTALIIERADIALGGAERSIAELAHALRKLDVDATILAAKGTAGSDNVRILCPHIPQKRVSLSVFADAIRKHLQSNTYDIVHSTLPFDFAHIYQPRGGAYPEAARRNAASYHSPLMRFLKDKTYFLNRKRTALVTAERNLCSSAGNTVIAALSQYVKRQFAEHYQLPEHRILVIPNAVAPPHDMDPSVIHQLKHRICTSLNTTGDSPRTFFLFAANNFRLKGLTDLLTAFARLSASATPAFLLIAGSGRQSPYLSLIRKLNVEKQVIFLGPLDDIQPALSIADVAVLPTYYDPCSRFILEAIALAKPVITTRFNGASERYTDNRHGRIIDDPADTDALADALTYLSDPLNVRNASSAIIADNLRSDISIASHAARLVDLYKLISSHRNNDS